jgi:hypothetical protein
MNASVSAIPAVANKLRDLRAALAGLQAPGYLVNNARMRRIANDLAECADTLDLVAELLRELGGIAPPPCAARIRMTPPRPPLMVVASETSANGL